MWPASLVQALHIKKGQNHFSVRTEDIDNSIQLQLYGNLSCYFKFELYFLFKLNIINIRLPFL
jgi:hypothetical protein